MTINPNPLNSQMIIIEKTHPLYELISSQFETKSIDEALASFEPYDLIIDLSILRTKKKVLLLKELTRTTKSQIISDLSLCWGEYIFQTCPHVSAAISMLFYSPTNAIEYALNPLHSNPVAATHLSEKLHSFLESIGKQGVNHQNLKLSFHYPRTIAMIINEAFFAIEENLASSEAIDLAMKNGVNYPLGPVEWGKKIGLQHVVELLTELHEVTEDPRYRISKELKLTSQQTLKISGH